jgi:hypothetical protein
MKQATMQTPRERRKNERETLIVTVTYREKKRKSTETVKIVKIVQNTLFLGWKKREKDKK